MPDSFEEAMAYFDTVVGDAGPASSPERRAAYVTEGANMVRFLQDEGLTFVRCEGYSDYYAGVRGIEGGVARGPLDRGDDLRRPRARSLARQAADGA